MLKSEASFSQYFSPDEEFLELLEAANGLEGTLPQPTADGSSTRPATATVTPVKQTKRYRSPDDGMGDTPPRPEDKKVEKYTDSATYAASTFGGYGQYMHNKRQKLQIQNQEIETKPKSFIFKGVAIYVNGYTIPSIQELRATIVQHGGVFQAYLDKKRLVTHIITTSITRAKLESWKHMKVVRPEWITDSVREGTKLDWKSYQFMVEDLEEEFQDGNQGSVTAPRPQQILDDVFGTIGLSTGKTSLGSSGTLTAVPVSSETRQLGNARITQQATSSHTAARGSNTVSKASQKPAVPAAGNASPVPHMLTSRAQPTPASTSSASWPANISKKPAISKVSENLSKPSNFLRPPPTASTSKQPRQRYGYGMRSPAKSDPLYITDPTTLEEAARVPGYAAHNSNPLAANAMKSTNFRASHTSVSDGFIEGFYKNSRLHYLSTWKAELKNIVAEALERSERAPPKQTGSGEAAIARPWLGEGKGKEKEWKNVYMHCDFDSFFVAVALLKRPDLKGKPVVVCHSQGETGGGSSTSEIASSSYAARAFGIRNGMSLGQARKLCPGIETLPYDFNLCKEISLKFYSLLMSLADDIQAVSVDEALIDVTTAVEGLKAEFTAANELGPVELAGRDFAKDFGDSLRSKVREATGCEVSIGISYNVMMARLATSRAKPAGSYHLSANIAQTFLATVDIRNLHGFGHAVSSKAEAKFGTTKLAELGEINKAILCKELGPKTGETIWNAARGVDNTKLESDKPRKSVSCDINFGIRFENDEQAEKFIYQMATEVSSRLSEISMRGKHLTLKIMKRHPTAPAEPAKFLGHGHCETFSKSSPIAATGGSATADAKVIGDQAWRLLRGFAFDSKELRGLAIQIQKLEPDQTKKGLLTTMARRRPPIVPAVPVPPPVLTLQPPSSPNAANDELDPDFLDALPPDIRAEVEQHHRDQKGKSPAKSKSTKRPDLARITRQLAPRSAASISVSKATFFRKKPPARKKLNVPLANLRKLGIDPEVFDQLPLADQKEQLAIHRALQRRSPHANQLFKARSKIEPIGRLKPGETAPIRPPPKANYIVEPVLIRKNGKGKEPSKLIETSEIQSVISSWIETFEDEAPREKDVSYFAKFLIQCVDHFNPTETPLIRAVHILRWWRYLLRDRWPEPKWSSVSAPVNPPTQIQTVNVGDNWWIAFWEVKSRMDIALRPKYGGIISLK